MQTPEEGRALFLRCLLSPVRLLSATMWHLIQQEVATHYGMLEDFVSLITDTVPDLLNYRQKTQLTIGLRARLVLELCGMETPVDLDAVRVHLQRIESIVALHKELQPDDALVENSGANFVALVQILMKDPAERSIFFKEVYPLQYGAKFNIALQKLMWLFLSGLENSLPHPTVEEAAHVLSTTPAVMEECIQFLTQPQQIQNLLKVQRKATTEKKETTQFWSSAPDDCILSCLSSSQSVQLLNEQRPMNTESVLEYVPSYCQEVQVESMVITQYVESELETSRSEENSGTHYCAQESKVYDPIGTRESTEDCYAENESLNTHTMDTGLDERSEYQDSVEVSAVGVESADGRKDCVAKQEEKRTALNQKEATQLISLYTVKTPFVKLHRLDLSGKQFSKTFNIGSPKRGRGRPKKLSQNKTFNTKKHEEKEITLTCALNNRFTGLTDGISSIVPKLKNKYTTGTSGEYTCLLCSFQDAEETQMHQHLIVHHPEEYKRLCVAEEGKEPEDVVSTPHESEIQNSPVSKIRSYRGVPVCKTCPTCNKTFTRSSDMRRHQVSHTVDRPFACQNCGKTFRYTCDLRRHQQRVCAHKDYVVVYQKRREVIEDGRLEIGACVSEAVCQDHHSLVKSSNKVGCFNSDSVIRSEIQPNFIISTEKLAGNDVSEPTCGGSNADPVNSHTRQHMRSPSSNYPHKCSQCNKGFKYSYNLKKHEDVCQRQGQDTDLEHGLSKEQESDTSEPGTSNSLNPALQQALCLDKQEQQRSDTRSTEADSFLTCSQCDVKCKDFNILTNHKQICASSEQFFKCVRCDALFKTELDVQKHVHIHWGEDPLQCFSCGKYYRSQSELIRHKLVHEKESKHPCTFCSDTHEQLKSLREHYLDVHDFKEPYKCARCDKTYQDIKSIVKHIKTHSEERPYKCSHCSKSFKLRGALTAHAKIHSTDKPFLCEECGKCFSSNISLYRHSVSHKTERPYTCPQCKNCFKTSYALRSHLLRHTREASIPCEICGKMFFQLSTLHRHRRTHTGERPYRCPNCDKTFLTSGEVSKHMRYHTGERPFQCTLCSKAFTQTCYLKIHMRIHTGERPYTCNICKRAFVCNTHLKRHMLIHSREKPFKCDCGKSFIQAQSLRVHQKNHCLIKEIV